MADQDKERDKALEEAAQAEFDPVRGDVLYHGPPEAPQPGPEPGVTFHPGSFGNPAPDDAPIEEPVRVDPEQASDAAPGAEATRQAEENPVEGPSVEEQARAVDARTDSRRGTARNRGDSKK